MRPCWVVGWALNPMIGVFRREEETHRSPVTELRRLERRSHVPRAARGHQELDQAGGILWKGLPTPWPQTWGLKNWEN